MSAAEREAEQRWPSVTVEEISYPRSAVRAYMHGAFVAGAEWQAERDAVQIAELEAEVEQWRRVAVEQTRLERDRAEAAEAKLAAVRALHQPLDAINTTAPPGRQRTRVCAVCAGSRGPWAVWPCATIQAIEGDQT